MEDVESARINFAKTPKNPVGTSAWKTVTRLDGTDPATRPPATDPSHGWPHFVLATVGPTEPARTAHQTLFTAVNSGVCVFYQCEPLTPVRYEKVRFPVFYRLRGIAHFKFFDQTIRWTTRFLKNP